MNEETAEQRRGRRRRFSRSLLPGALLLVLVGGLLATLGGSLKILGFLALAQGIGLIVAMIPLALGRNPISKD